MNGTKTNVTENMNEMNTNRVTRKRKVTSKREVITKNEVRCKQNYKTSNKTKENDFFLRLDT